MNKILLLCLLALMSAAHATSSTPPALLTTFPAPAWIDERDLDKTMKVMGQALRDLKAATSTAEMVAPVTTILRYSGQAELIGLVGAKPALAAQYQVAIKALRQEIWQLNQLIAKNDFNGAKAVIAKLNDMRRDGHRRFKNY